MKEKSIKILYVIDTLCSSGAERSLLEITRNFTKVIPVFVHIYSENELKKDFLKNGIQVYSLDVAGPWNLKLAKQRLKMIYDLEQPDAVHATLFRSQIITRQLKKYYPCIPLVNSFVSESYSAEKLKNRSYLRKIKGSFIHIWDIYTAKKVNYFISNSETIKYSMAKFLKVPLEKVRVIYRGRDVNRFNSGNKERLDQFLHKYNLRDRKILINVGRLIDSKGQMDIIEIMPRILANHPETILLIAGEGNNRRPLEKKIEERSLQNKVILLGNRSDIPDLLSLSDVFVFPTYLEGLPGAMIEAMFAKSIICCSNIAVNLECVDDSSAVVFKVGDKNDLFEKLHFTLSNLPLLKERSEKAFIIASEKFDINHISAHYERFYSEITGVCKKSEF